jgi:hypothetical protein
MCVASSMVSQAASVAAEGVSGTSKGGRESSGGKETWRTPALGSEELGRMDGVIRTIWERRG